MSGNNLMIKLTNNKILTKLQQKVLEIFFKQTDLAKHFYLTGGTALAGFYLEHRYSDDLDFFSHSIDIYEASKLFEDLLKDNQLHFVGERSSSGFRRYLVVNELQVDLVRDIDFRVAAPLLHEGLLIDDVKNIAVNKIGAIYGRLDPKDYVDWFFIQQVYQYNFFELFELAKNKDAGLELFSWAQIINDVNNFEHLPNMLKPLSVTQLKKYFNELRVEILKKVKP